MVPVCDDANVTTRGGGGVLKVRSLLDLVAA
jgi:hypothetical protein